MTAFFGIAFNSGKIFFNLKNNVKHLVWKLKCGEKVFFFNFTQLRVATVLVFFLIFDFCFLKCKYQNILIYNTLLY